MMDTERMIRELKREADKHRYDTLLTFGTNITALCTDVIPKLEQLKRYEAIGTVEECREAREKRRPALARKTTIFEGKDAEKLILKGLPNYETYKCPKCGRIVAERTVVGSIYPDGFIKKNYCEKCGQAIDWSAE